MIAAIDHVVLTTADIDKCIEFYTRVLGMRVETFAGGRLALRFGDQKLNLHEAGREIEPKATLAKPGTLDLCFLADRPLDEVITALQQQKVTIVRGPVAQTGARFALRSVYVRDPDGNLIEIAERAESA
jgi:catechol 2,3-dioxygenase-like lactoylglutathione lyase family enzyme